MKNTAAFTLFDTAIGRCAIAWGPSGVLCLRLPEKNDEVLRNAMRDIVTFIEEKRPTKDMTQKIARIVSLLEGGRDDLRSIQVDMTGMPEFHRRVYEVSRTILPGETMTYGEVAKALGEPGAARAVGAALGANPIPIIVPCHRVLGANGKMTGFTAPGGVNTKMRLLSIERARIGREPTLFDNDSAFVLASRRERDGRNS
jgi:methylated-DNA-[protein]-cysteine S-methyltransferase